MLERTTLSLKSHCQKISPLTCLFHPPQPLPISNMLTEDKLVVSSWRRRELHWIKDCQTWRMLEPNKKNAFRKIFHIIPPRWALGVFGFPGSFHPPNSESCLRKLSPARPRKKPLPPGKDWLSVQALCAGNTPSWHQKRHRCQKEAFEAKGRLVQGSHFSAISTSSVVSWP